MIKPQKTKKNGLNIKLQKSIFQHLENPHKTQNNQNICAQVNFCPQCGSLLEISNKGAPSLSCLKCGFKKLLKQNERAKLNIRHGRPREIVVIDKNEESLLRTLPTVKVICPTCGKAESETWIVGIGGEAAPSTVTFFRCIKCGTIMRETG